MVSSHGNKSHRGRKILFAAGIVLFAAGTVFLASSLELSHLLAKNGVRSESVSNGASIQVLSHRGPSAMLNRAFFVDESSAYTVDGGNITARSGDVVVFYVYPQAKETPVKQQVTLLIPNFPPDKTFRFIDPISYPAVLVWEAGNQAPKKIQIGVQSDADGMNEMMEMQLEGDELTPIDPMYAKVTIETEGDGGSLPPGSLEGYLWNGSEMAGSGVTTGMGWVSLSNVVVPQSDGNVIGYGWFGHSDDGGSGGGDWIDFNPQDHCNRLYDAKSCYAPNGTKGGVKRDGNTLVGFARLVDVAQASSMDNSGDWDGWVEMHNVTIDPVTGMFSGYAWNGETRGPDRVIEGYGWMDFSGVRLKPSQ